MFDFAAKPHAFGLRGEHSVAVFLGPSLPVAQARQICPAHYFPPARLGDVYRLLGSPVHRIVLIDGRYYGAAAIWQRELREALEQGIEVFGAASIGALRAVELEACGMRGFGEVFAAFRAGLRTDDGDVALLHSLEATPRAMSFTLVGVVAALETACERKLIQADQVACLLKEAEGLWFGARDWHRLKAQPTWRALDEHYLIQLGQLLKDQHNDIKARDARTVLRAAASEPLRNETQACQLTPSHYSDFYQKVRLSFAGFARETYTPGATLLARIKADMALQDRWRCTVLSKFYGRFAADRAGFKMTSDCQSDFATKWLDDHELILDDPFFARNGISQVLWRTCLAEHARVHLYFEAQGRERALADLARLFFEQVQPWSDQHAMAYLLKVHPRQIGFSTFDESQEILKLLQLQGKASDL